MGYRKFARGLAPLAGLAAATALTACDADMSVDYDGEGVPLAELDLSGDAPTGFVLAGSDNIEVTAGDTFDVQATGSDDATEALRFVLEDGALVVYRESGSSSDSATVNVTVPTVDSLVLVGSGSITSDAIGRDAKIVVTGSGDVTVRAVSADSLDIDIPGSGNVTASGMADRLSITVIGSGDLDLSELEAERAEATIIGSGDTSIASNGRVEATFIGSGDVWVTGDATCESTGIGSGRLSCEGG